MGWSLSDSSLFSSVHRWLFVRPLEEQPGWKGAASSERVKELPTPSRLPVTQARWPQRRQPA